MTSPLAESRTLKKLAASAERIALPENHLRHLLTRENRFTDFSCSGGGLFFDYFRQRVDRDVMQQLRELALEGIFCSGFQTWQTEPL